MGTIILLLYLPIEELPKRIMATKINRILKLSISQKKLTLTFLQLFLTMEKVLSDSADQDRKFDIVVSNRL